MARVVLLGSDPRMMVNFRLSLVTAMIARGHALLCVAPGMAADPVSRAVLEAAGARTADVPMARAGLSPLGDLTTLVALTRLLRREGADLILSYTVKPVVWGTIAAALARVPRRAAMLTGLGYAFTGDAGQRRGVRRVVRALLRTALSRAHVLILHNRDDRDLIARERLTGPATRLVVVDGSGVDLAAFAPAPLPPAPPIRVLMIGRLVGDKGAGDYLAAARLLAARGAPVTCALVGDVDANPDSLAEAAVAQAVAAAAIDWTRRLDDVRPAIAAAHIVVLPSHREGLPRALVEAMAMGRAIVATDAPGCRETVVAPDNGLLVPVGDAAALADAIAALAGDPGRLAAMGAASRRIAAARFGTDTIDAAMLAALGLDR